jgi:DNA-binding NarL/FixJ family response regulator
MRFCANCPERDTCHRICEDVERMLQSEEGYRRELLVSPDKLEYLSALAQVKGLELIPLNKAPQKKNGEYDWRIQVVLDSPAILSNNHKRVLKLILKGLTNTEISKRMGISGAQVTKSQRVIAEKVKYHTLIGTWLKRGRTRMI